MEAFIIFLQAVDTFEEVVITEVQGMKKLSIDGRALDVISVDAFWFLAVCWETGYLNIAWRSFDTIRLAIN